MSITIPQFFAATGDPITAGLSKVIERYSKVAGVLPVKRDEALTHKYGKETSLGGVSRRVINQAFADVEGGTVTPAEESLLILGRKVETDYRLNSANGEARAGEIARAMRATTREIDNEIVNGDGGSESLRGFKARCEGNQLIEAGENGAQLTLDIFNRGVDAVIDQGAGIHAFMPKAIFRKFKKLVLAEAGGAAVADVTSEIPVYEGVKLHVIGDKLDGSPILDFNETQGNDAQTASVYIVAPGNDDVELSGVKLIMASNSIELIEEGVRNSMVIDTLEVAFGLAVYDSSALARISGIKKPA